MRIEADYTSLDFGYTLNNTANMQSSIPASGLPVSLCCEVLSESEPWRDEVVLYRDRTLVWAGPLISVSASAEDGSLQANDLSHWMEQRFMPDFHGEGDAGDVFAAVFNAAYDPDTSPNIDLTTRGTGIRTSVNYKQVEYHRAADALRDLSTYGVDWTMVGRRLLAGGKEVFLSDTPLLLHDDGVTSAEVVKEGSNLATDVAVFGATLELATQPVTGRATIGDEYYGLIQRSFTQLLCEDRIACDAAAEARLQGSQPAPLRLNVTLSQEAAFEFTDLIPGRRFDVRLGESACIAINQEMRLQSVGVNVQEADETVKLSLTPVGVGE